jgi:hypothetical protein
VFDDLFDGFQHVPPSCQSSAHFQQIRQSLRPGGICVKNLIWDPRSTDTCAACDEAYAALCSAFPHHALLRLGPEHRGHNRLLLGLTEPLGFALDEMGMRLRLAGVPEELAAAVSP